MRQDFPTALEEQIKEKEVADQHAAMYHEMVSAQAEADAIVAKQLADKLKKEEMERRRNIEQSEFLALRLQEDLLLDSTNAHPVLESSVANELPIPPKNLGMKFNGQRRQFSENEIVSNPSYVSALPTHRLSPVKDSAQLNYVSLELNVPKDSQKRLHNHHATQYTQVIAHNQGFPSPPLPSDSDSHHYEHINLHSHTPEKKSNPQPYVQRDYSFPSSSNEAISLPPKPNKIITSPTKIKSKQYELPKLPPKSKDMSQSNRGLQMLTTDSFDMLMGNRNSREVTDECDSLAVGNEAEASTSRHTERIFDSNTADLNRIDSIDDILNYDDEEAAAAATSSTIKTDRIRQLQEFGVPADEILEIDRRLTQQEKDEELARRLQEEEVEEGGKIMTQEEKDRMVAIEAQDKELAKMLQERVSLPFLRQKKSYEIIDFIEIFFRKKQKQEEQRNEQEQENSNYNRNDYNKKLLKVLNM